MYHCAMPKLLINFRSLLQVLILLFLGSGSYIFFRGLPFLNNLKLLSIQGRYTAVTSFVLFNVPDALWLYAFLSVMKIIWKEDLFFEGRYWLYSIIFIAPCTEVAQKFHIIPGTFDWLDIACYSAATLFFFYFNKPKFITPKKVCL